MVITKYAFSVAPRLSINGERAYCRSLGLFDLNLYYSSLRADRIVPVLRSSYHNWFSFPATVGFCCHVTIGVPGTLLLGGHRNSFLIN